MFEYKSGVLKSTKKEKKLKPLRMQIKTLIFYYYCNQEKIRFDIGLKMVPMESKLEQHRLLLAEKMWEKFEAFGTKNNKMFKIIKHL